MDQSPLTTRLMPGERVLWSGRPATGLMFTGRDVFLVPFSLLWCGFAVFWTVQAVGSGAPFFFYVFGLVFVGIGVFFVGGRFALDAWLRKRTFYAVTDQRVLIQREGPYQSFTSIELARLPDMQMVGMKGAQGTLRFGAAAPMFMNGGWAIWIPSLQTTPQFLRIADVTQVFNLILRTGRQASPSARAS